MIPRILLIAALGVCSLTAAEPSTEDLLRQGLFEEEANRDFDKASENYRAVIAAHDKQRALAATATYRLGEIARKKNDKESAAKAFQLVAERYPEQTELARLSRENLVALGVNLPTPEKTDAPPAVTTIDPEETEIARLKDIASNSPDLIDGADPNGWRPMHTAAKNGWTKVIAYLLENKADPNSRTAKEQYTPLHLAAIHGQLAAVKSLLAAKADINTTTDRPMNSAAMEQKAQSLHGDWSAIDFAVLYDRKEIARTLIKAGADIQQSRLAFGPYQASEPFTTLQAAIYLNRTATALDLIEAGAPLERVGGERATSPLSLAVRECPDLVAPLLKAGAKPNDTGTSLDTTPLIEAAIKDRLAAAKLLLDAGADANAANRDGQTPLHLVHLPEMVELLVSRGANPNAKDKRGDKPLDSLARREEQNQAAFEAFLKHGVVVDDAKELVKLTSTPMLPVVRERVGYPKECREDAILFSSGNLLKIADIRPAAGSPPPPLHEALAYLENQSLASLKIIRRDADGKFMKRFEHLPDHDRSSLATPPPLEWGDIVEAEVAGNSASSSFRLIPDEIPPQSITIRIGGISFPRRFTAPSGMWLNPINPEKESSFGQGGRQPRPRVVPHPAPGYQPQPGQPGQPVSQPPSFSLSCLMPDYFDLSRITVTRKGVEKPIPVDLTQKSSRVFRLIDGDVLELVLLESFRKEMEGKKQALFLSGDFARAGSWAAHELLRSLIEARNPNSGNVIQSEPDWSDIRILRNGNGLKAERFDFVDWTRKLPPDKAWTEATLANVPTLKPGDIVVIPLIPEDANEDRREANKNAESQILSNWKVIIPPNASGPPREPGSR